LERLGIGSVHAVGRLQREAVRLLEPARIVVKPPEDGGSADGPMLRRDDEKNLLLLSQARSVTDQ